MKKQWTDRVINYILSCGNCLSIGRRDKLPSGSREKKMG